MWIKKIKIKNFRNYEQEIINFEKNLNIFYGENAQGKTNILEAIFLCSFGKSFRTKKDKEMININKKDSYVEIYYEKSDREGKISIELNDKKNIFINNIKIKKLSELIGKVNLVLFTPDDINVLKGSPQNRRRFLNILISQLRPNYIYVLNSYLKIMEQRNNYLRQIRDEKKDESLLEIWDEKLAENAQIISNYRNEFINKILKINKNIHKKITDNSEEFNIKYFTDCLNKDDFLKILKERRKIDIIKGFTTRGVHRDDFSIDINDKELAIYGSQGQFRTAMLSLKLSELQVIYDEIGEYPILLLDDFMSELDEKRKKSFLDFIQKNQVFITGTTKLDIENLKYLEYNVSNGCILNKK